MNRTDFYINNMLNIVKTDMSQANAKLGMVITSNSGILMFSSIVITLVNLFSIPQWTIISFSIVFGLLVFLQLVSIIYCFRSLKAEYTDVNPNEAEEFDMYNFFTFAKIDRPEFLSKFEITDEHQKGLLEQIYTNGVLAHSRYNKADKALKVSLLMIFTRKSLM